jgi:hypothetical protein
MLKKLLLTAALLSSTYGGLEYFDPDFSQLAGRSDDVVINERGVVINPEESKPSVLRRLTKAEISEVLSSNDFNVFCESELDCIRDIWNVRLIYIILIGDCTPGNGYSKEQDAAFLSHLFWSRVELLEQLVQVMLLSPQIITDDPAGTLKQQQEKLTAFSKRYDHTDITPFIKGHWEDANQLMDEFKAIHNE